MENEPKTVMLNGAELEPEQPVISEVEARVINNSAQRCATCQQSVVKPGEPPIYDLRATNRFVLRRRTSWRFA